MIKHYIYDKANCLILYTKKVYFMFLYSSTEWDYSDLVAFEELFKEYVDMMGGVLSRILRGFWNFRFSWEGFFLLFVVNIGRKLMESVVWFLKGVIVDFWMSGCWFASKWFNHLKAVLICRSGKFKAVSMIWRSLEVFARP